jgi:hypothetical protein
MDTQPDDEINLKIATPQMGSEQIMIMTFYGAKSGKMNATPVSYSRENQKVICFTIANGLKNIKKCAIVRIRMQGLHFKGVAK